MNTNALRKSVIDKKHALYHDDMMIWKNHLHWARIEGFEPGVIYASFVIDGSEPIHEGSVMLMMDTCRQ
jgi:hypothetical protein